MIQWHLNVYCCILWGQGSSKRSPWSKGTSVPYLFLSPSSPMGFLGWRTTAPTQSQAQIWVAQAELSREAGGQDAVAAEGPPLGLNCLWATLSMKCPSLTSAAPESLPSAWWPTQHHRLQVAIRFVLASPWHVPSPICWEVPFSTFMTALAQAGCTRGGLPRHRICHALIPRCAIWLANHFGTFGRNHSSLLPWGHELCSVVT